MLVCNEYLPVLDLCGGVAVVGGAVGWTNASGGRFFGGNWSEGTGAWSENSNGIGTKQKYSN